MLSLSLALLNLLALPGLDGAHMLEAAMDRWFPGTSGLATHLIGPNDSDGSPPLRHVTVRDQVLRRRIERIILYLSTSTAILTVSGGVMEVLVSGQWM